MNDNQRNGDQDMIDINFNAPPAPKCKHCGKTKMNHKAKTYNCPFGRGNFPHFREDKFFEPKLKRGAMVKEN